MPQTLADLPESVESRITRLFLAAVRADAFFSDVFRPITLVENPTLQALYDYAVYTLVVQPFTVAPSDMPSKRQTSVLTVVLSFYLPQEQRSEDSDLFWLRLYDKVRRFSYGMVLTDPVLGKMQFSDTRVEPLVPLNPPQSATTILSYRVIFETDINPMTGALITV